MIIRQAIPTDSKILTDISFAAKNYWNYPQEYFEIWKEELTITDEYIDKNYVFVAENDKKVIGYYSVVILEKNLVLKDFTIERGIWLEHVFIHPEFIGQGYGTELMRHLVMQAQKRKWGEVKILADPHSTEFYKKLGASYIEEIPSNISGRTVSYFKWTMEQS